MLAKAKFFVKKEESNEEYMPCEGHLENALAITYESIPHRKLYYLPKIKVVRCF